MSVPTNIPVEALEAFCNQFGVKTGIFLGHIPEGDVSHVVTWGDSVEQSLKASEVGNQVKQLLGWPANLCNEEPSKVTDLRQEIEQLKMEKGLLHKALQEAQIENDELENKNSNLIDDIESLRTAIDLGDREA